MRIGMREIAKAAGVSPATVSNALNGRRGVSEETVERVRAVARDLGYVLEPAAPEVRPYVRLLVFRRHGLVVMDTQFFAELIESIEQACNENGLELMISHLNRDKDDGIDDRIRAICREECAGILLIGTEAHPEDLRPFEGCASPLVVLDNLFAHEPVNTVVMDNYDTGYQAVRLLHAKGHRRIGHITSSVVFNNIRYRQRGYEAAMKHLDLAISPKDILPVTPTLEGSYQDMSALLRTHGKPQATAFFAANDIMAVGCMRAMTDYGMRLPEEASIVGMDDMSLCQICMPALSTFRVYRCEMGRLAVKRLLEISGADRDTSFVLKTMISVRYVERESVLAIAP